MNKKETILSFTLMGLTLVFMFLVLIFPFFASIVGICIYGFIFIALMMYPLYILAFKKER